MYSSVLVIVIAFVILLTIEQLRYISGGGIASNEAKLSMPFHNNDLSYLKPHLNYLAHMYAINLVCTVQYQLI